MCYSTEAFPAFIYTRLRIRQLIVFFIIGLVVSGLTAFPLNWELSLLEKWLNALEIDNDFSNWIHRVGDALRKTDTQYPFMQYGTDWLAFSHLVIAVVFIGPLRDPLRNKWVIDFGLIACAGVLPLAIVAGEIRGIPWFWRIIDSLFGIFGACLLWQCRLRIKKLEQIISRS